MGDQSFARIVRRRRDSLGLSQARLGELVGRSASTIRNWERGTATPSDSSDVVALAAVLGVAEGDLLEQAGFQPSEVETAPTVEESFASLTAETKVAEVPPDADYAADYTDDDEVSPVAPAAGIDESEVPVDFSDPDPVVELEPSSVDPEQKERFGDGEEPKQIEADSEPEDDVFDISPAGVPPVPEWGRGEQAAGEIPRRRLRRAAPPTVLETAPVGEPSYVEEPTERQRYRVRAFATTIVVLGLLIVLVWSFDRTTDALSAMWNDVVGMLSI